MYLMDKSELLCLLIINQDTIERNNMKKLISIITILLLVFSPINIMADDSNNDNDVTNYKGPACQYSRSYSETIGNSWEDIQFRHVADSNSVPSSVTYDVTVTSSLALTLGGSGNVNFLLANSSVDFELSYIGSIARTISITWDNIPANETHVLIAGKRMASVNGKITTIFTDCSNRVDNISVKGSTETFHRSYRQ